MSETQVRLQLESDLRIDQLPIIAGLLDLIKDIPGDIVEIGSWKCGTSAIMALYSGKTVHAFDIFGGLPYGEGKGYEWFKDADWEEIQNKVSWITNLKLVRGLHEETVPIFAESKIPLAMIFMDSDHYSSHKVSLTHLCPLLVPHGLLVFHDLFEEVVQAMQEFVSEDEFEIMEGCDLQKMCVLRKKA